MENSILIGGFGGQGVMIFGQLLCYTAAETTDKYVTYFPSYSMEKRGGTANCYVTISDEPIGAPKAEMTDYVVALNSLAMNKFVNNVYSGGTMFINSSVCTEKPDRADITFVEVPASDVAREIGDSRVTNLCMIGAFIAYTDMLPPEKVLATAFKKLGAKHPEFNALNEAAFKKGMEIGRAAKAKKA